MTKKITLFISGMHCASCASVIENALKKEEGIISASVNYASEKLTLEFEKEKITLEKIQAILQKLGYTVQENSDESDHEDQSRKDLQKLKIRFLSTLLFSAPIIYMVMGEMLSLPMPKFLEEYGVPLQLFLTSAVILAALNIWTSGLKKLFALHPNMDSLIFIGTATAYFYSLIIFTLPLLGLKYESPLYFESAALILTFISLGKYLEAITKGKTSEALKKLIGLQPKTAFVFRSSSSTKLDQLDQLARRSFSEGGLDKFVETPIANLILNDFVLVKPGEKIPTDGIVIKGNSFVDESMITGESMPIEKKINDTVIGGTINQSGILIFKVNKIGQETMLAQIIKLVEGAMGSKAPIQLLADKVSFYFVPTIIAIAFFSFLAWLIVGQPLSFALSVFVAVLIIACPCALGLATPTAVMMGTGLAAQKGILIKSAKALEIAHNLDVVVFDKTGTLTAGKPVVTDVISFPSQAFPNFPNFPNSLLQLAASVEANSEHPLAKAIVVKAQEENIKLNEVKDFQAIPGHGVSALWQNKKILLGTRKLMSDNQITMKQSDNETMEKLENEGKTAMILATDKEAIGLLAVADTLKEYSQEAIALLHKMRKKTAILTGDNQRVAQAIAQQVNIDYVLAEVLPQDKAKVIKQIQDGQEFGISNLLASPKPIGEGGGFGASTTRRVVAMIGDGINDAPALAQADLGIAMGSGTDIAMETGEIVLVKNDLRDVIAAIDISRYTIAKIKQNLFWAFFYNIVGIPVAAGVLYPSTGWLLNPALAALAMAFSSISVVSNALLMKRYRGK